MSNALRKPAGLADYLAAEAASPIRHEYLGGHVYAMTGGSLRHNRIAGNIYARLLQELSGSPCQVFINDVKLHVQAADCVYCPDLLVHCGNGPAGSEQLVTDAALIVKVLSDSTAMTDRREKRAAYQRLNGLRACWIISQEERRAEVYLRDAHGGWASLTCGAQEALPTQGLTAADVPLALAHVGTDIACGLPAQRWLAAEFERAGQFVAGRTGHLGGPWRPVLGNAWLQISRFFGPLAQGGRRHGCQWTVVQF